MIELEKLPRSRNEARDLGSRYYFTGKPCKSGHVSHRLTSSATCFECNHLQSKKWAEENVEKSREIYKKRYYKDHDESKRKHRIRHKNKRDNDPVVRQNNTIHTALRHFIKKGYWSKHFDQFGYTRESLREHFENQFTGEMSWDSHGVTWVIDHVKPKSKCESLEECWTLSNLQPLPPKENLYKHNKYEVPESNNVKVAQKEQDFTEE